MPGDTAVKGWVVVNPDGTLRGDSFQVSPIMARCCIAMRDEDFQRLGYRVVPATLRVHLGDRKEGV